MGGAKFGQVECAKFLKRCETNEEALAVLSAYCLAKYAKGNNSAQVARKIHLATCYFRGIRMHDLLAKFNDAFIMVTYDVRHLNGHGLGDWPAQTAVGIEAWNVARRVCAKHSKHGFRAPTGSAPLTPVQSITSGHTRSTGLALSDYSSDSRIAWRCSEETIADAGGYVPVYPPPDLPSYTAASPVPPRTGMTRS